MASQANFMPVLSEAELPLAQPAALSQVALLWHDVRLFAHLATLAWAAMSFGCGLYSLEIARWSVNVLRDAALAAAE